MSVWDSKTGARKTVLHEDKETKVGDVVFVSTHTEDSTAVWTYLYPGQ